MILTSTITCPACGHQATETMPTNACQFFYDCAGCGRRPQAPLRSFQDRYGIKSSGEADNQTLFALGEVDLAVD